MAPSCPLGTTRCIPRKKFHRKPYNKSFIDQVCSVKMVGYWPHSFFASLWTSTSCRSINTQKKNLANIQPSWHHTWSITHTDQIILFKIQFNYTVDPEIIISTERANRNKTCLHKISSKTRVEHSPRATTVYRNFIIKVRKQCVQLFFHFTSNELIQLNTTVNKLQ